MPNLREEDKSSRNEMRLWNILIAACLALGGIWLQNQYDTVLRLQAQIAAFSLHVQGTYVNKELLNQITGDQTRRFDSIERKLDVILHRVERPPSNYQYAPEKFSPDGPPIKG